MPILLSVANLADQATLSGGSWETLLPLANLQQEFLSLYALSTNDTAASTKLQVDFGSATAIRMVGIGRHNMGDATTATFRVKAGTTAGASNVHDSTSLNVADRSYRGTLTYDCGSNVSARYWTIEFVDAYPGGRLQISRLWMGVSLTFSRSYAYGNAFGFEPRDVSEESLGGVLFHDRRTPRRIVRLPFKALTTAEANGALQDAQGNLGTAGQLWFVKHPTDMAAGFKANGLYRFRKFDPIAQLFKNLHETAIELEEVL